MRPFLLAVVLLLLVPALLVPLLTGALSILLLLEGLGMAPCRRRTTRT